MAQIYANGTSVASNKSILEVVVPRLSIGGNLAVTTNNVTGSTYTAFTSQPCSQLTISNDSTVNLDILQGGAGVPFKVISGTYYTVFGLNDANQISARRSDVSASAITISARWES